MLQQLLAHRFEIWLVVVPVIVFWGGCKGAAWRRSLRLATLIMAIYGSYRLSIWLDPPPGPERCCPENGLTLWDLLVQAWFVTLGMILVGWWELLRRMSCRLVLLRGEQNRQHGVVSNLVVLVSVVIPTIFLFLFMYNDIVDLFTAE